MSDTGNSPGAKESRTESSPTVEKSKTRKASLTPSLDAAVRSRAPVRKLTKIEEELGLGETETDSKTDSKTASNQPDISPSNAAVAAADDDDDNDVVAEAASMLADTTSHM